MAFYKSVQRFELGMTELKSCKSPEWDSNAGQPDCKLDTLTARSRCLLLPPFHSNYDVKSPDSTSRGVCLGNQVKKIQISKKYKFKERFC